MQGRVIITVLGKDKVGIVAGVSKKLNELEANIVDITQTIFEDELFAMIMLVEGKRGKYTLEEFQSDLIGLEGELGVKIYVQHEEIFKVMHRI